MTQGSSDIGALRILDANLNRAREAFRVMEEYARFVLDDASLTAEIKEARHALGEALPQRVRQRLLVARDTHHDVGTNVTVEGEFRRSHSGDVAVAAGRRLSEALRVIEEYGKLLDPDWAACVEKIRYHGYELDRRLSAHTRAKDAFGSVRLYVLITESLCRRDWLTTAEAALRGGADAIQLREKALTDAELVDRARRLAALCRRHGALSIINDRPDIAALAGAGGVHLGQDDLSVAEARRIVPASGVVGVSTHTVSQIGRAVEAAPDYIAVGPMFPSATKPQSQIAGPGALVTARAATSIPLVAIGGIDAENAGEVLAAGASCLCVCAAVISQDDVTAAAARLRRVMEVERGVSGAPQPGGGDGVQNGGHQAS